MLTARLNTTFTRFNTGHFFAKKTQNVTILVNGWYDLRQLQIFVLPTNK